MIAAKKLIAGHIIATVALFRGGFNIVQTENQELNSICCEFMKKVSICRNSDFWRKCLLKFCANIFKILENYCSNLHKIQMANIVAKWRNAQNIVNFNLRRTIFWGKIKLHSS